MCGIFFSISTKKSTEPSADLLSLLQHRGPDSTQKFLRTVQLSLTDGTALNVHLTFVSTVLALRGDGVVRQPYTRSDTSSILCWNGEAWLVDGQKPEGNDTAVIFNLLHTHSDHDSIPEKVFSERLALIAGPYAFIYFDASRQIVYFGRDFLGRRSLLWNTNANGDLILSSVTSGELCQEVEADGIYSLDLRRMTQHDGHERRQFSDFPITQHGFPTASQIGNLSRSVRYEKKVVPRLVLQTSELDNSVLPLTENSPCVSTLHQHLQDSLTLRVKNIPDITNDAQESLTPVRAHFAVLFSGGLDCTLLARLAHDLIPIQQPIDLLNVAFENPRVHKNIIQADNASGPYELCPDRVTGRASFAELCSVCPERTWRFVAVNVPYSETVAHREQVLRLMYPHNTEMDLSISYALYFASRGAGLAFTSSTTEAYNYTTPARVLLSGLGADELFGGYTRHATAYRRGGVQGLLDELALDIGRLGKRNLGRDDRVISHWGKEVRFPYLDESLVQWVLDLPVQSKCGFLEQVSEPTEAVSYESQHLEASKKALRCLAWKLGMPGVAKEKKRAIQFGARTAKMETGKTKGTTLVS